jgi:ABC-type hemin transport system substrate-binding protein
MTESFFDLGLGSALAGITDYCIHPAAAVKNLPRLGGPKNPHVQAIIDLQPDLVVANMEENTPQAVEALEAAGLQVWVTFPRTVRQSMDVLWTLVGLFHDRAAGMRVEMLEVTLDWALTALASSPPLRYFCPIWFDQTAAGQLWWMTFNQDTYCHDLLRILGGVNSFAARQRLYPLDADLGKKPPEDPAGRDTRYPRLPLDEIRAAQPELVLLPSEPYAFGSEQRQQLLQALQGTPAGQPERFVEIDGSLITWHGTRLAHALRDLPGILDAFR